MFYFIYIWLRIEPNLYFLYKQPAFYFMPQFIGPYLNYPGGLLEAFGALLSQFYLIPPLGAFILSTILLGIALTTRYWIVTIGGGKSTHLCLFIPVVLLFMLYHDYGYPLEGSLGLLAALLVFTIHSRIFRSRPLFFWVISLLTLPLFYYLCGGPVFLFALLCILYVLSDNSQKWILRILMALSFLIMTGLLPFLSIKQIMIAQLQERMFGNLLTFYPSHLPWASWLIYGFYPLTYLCVRVFKISGVQKQLQKIKISSIHRIYQFASIVILSGLAALYTFDQESKSNFSAEYLAHEHRWDEVLDIVRDQPTLNIYTSVQANRALYHTGQLLDSMFAYPQDWGKHGLFHPQEYSYMYPLQISDLFFDLGHVTESQHWAYEAQAIHKDSPWNLQRLVQTHLLKGNLPTARRYLYTLERSSIFKKWADVHLLFVEQPARILKNTALRDKYNLMPRTDFIVHSAIPQDDLEGLLKSNPNNRMALEYLIANHLLSKQLDLIADHTKSLIRFKYPHIPTHLEEAFLIYLTSDASHNLAIPGYQIRQSTAEKFKDYLRIANKHRDNPSRMKEELHKKYGNTYWFYYYFHKELDIKAILAPVLELPGKKK
ncbi:hypothetical protein HQ585_02715 [candidate division KSB1 bacterium]|nr:hypothetical protein [candidate division KSB1 bacterium]